jgi:hypothetical protein
MFQGKLSQRNSNELFVPVSKNPNADEKLQARLSKPAVARDAVSVHPSEAIQDYLDAFVQGVPAEELIRARKRAFGRLPKGRLQQCLQQFDHYPGGITEIDLDQFNLSDPYHAALLAATLEQEVTVKSLTLSECRLSNEGLSAVCKLLTSEPASSCLKSLNLSSNPLDAPAGKLLAASLDKNRSLRQLYLGKFCLNLREMAGGKITELNYANKDVGVGETIVIAHAVSIFPGSITRIDLSANNLLGKPQRSIFKGAQPLNRITASDAARVGAGDTAAGLCKELRADVSTASIDALVCCAHALSKALIALAHDMHARALR